MHRSVHRSVASHSTRREVHNIESIPLSLSSSLLPSSKQTFHCAILNQLRLIIKKMSGPSPSTSVGRSAKGGSDALAFLVHSHPNLPPEVDNQALARQKRRRTWYDFCDFLVVLFECDRKRVTLHLR
jgi:hypothetical protein